MKLDDFLRKNIPLDCPSDNFVDNIMLQCYKKSIFVRIFDWIIEKQSTMILNMTYYITNSIQKSINNYNILISAKISDEFPIWENT